MNKDSASHCDGCGKSIPVDAPDGLCPRCVSEGLLKILDGVEEKDKRVSLSELNSEFENYEVLELLGPGGMGIVYKAQQTQLGRPVALKLFPTAAVRDPEFAERFRQEARAMARLCHPNIVTVYDFGETSTGCPYFAMEYVDGIDLAALVLTKPTPAQVLEIAPQICAGLQYAHEQKIVHRDIKPSNILVAKNGTVKIADFGLARLFDEEEGANPFPLTKEGSTLGTPDYIAPEQTKGTQTDHRSDIYSLGVVIYELLTGDLPKGVFELPSQKNSEVDVRFDDIVHKAMQERPERRFQKADDLRTRIISIQSSASEKEGAGHGMHPLKPLAVILLGCLVAGAIYLLFVRSFPTGSDSEADSQPKNLAAQSSTAIEDDADSSSSQAAPMRTGSTRKSRNLTAALVQKLSEDERAKLLSFLDTGEPSALESIPGGGSQIASSLVDARPIKQLEDVASIAGIGPKKLETIISHAQTLP